MRRRARYEGRDAGRKSKACMHSRETRAEGADHDSRVNKNMAIARIDRPLEVSA